MINDFEKITIFNNLIIQVINFFEEDICNEIPETNITGIGFYDANLI